MEEIKPQTPPTQQPPQPTQTKPQSPVLNKMPSLSSASKISRFMPVLIIGVILTFGIFSGLVLSSKMKGSQSSQQGTLSPENLSSEQKQSFNQTFRDQAEGVIERNDKLDKYAQGTHKLIRPGGESQTAYLTSSTLDLDEYNGKKVKVFGETFGSSQVGWLMDVGKVEEIN